MEKDTFYQSMHLSFINKELNKLQINSKQDYYNAVFTLYYELFTKQYSKEVVCIKIDFLINILERFDSRARKFNPILLKIKKKYKMSGLKWFIFCSVFVVDFFSLKIADDADNLIRRMLDLYLSPFELKTMERDFYELKKNELIDFSDYGTISDIRLNDKVEDIIEKDISDDERIKRLFAPTAIRSKEEFYNHISFFIRYTADHIKYWGYMGERYKYVLERLAQIEREGKRFQPFILKIKEKYAINGKEWIVFLYFFVYNYFESTTIDFDDITDYLEDLNYGMIEIKRTLNIIQRFLKEGILERETKQGCGLSTIGFSISPSIIEMVNKELGIGEATITEEELEAGNERRLSFFDEKTEEEHSKKSYLTAISEIRKKYDLILRPKVNTLFFDSNLEKEFELIKKSIRNYKKFINFQNILDKQMTILLYGPSGTGKTAFVYSLAREFDIPIMRVDSSHIFTMWFGESEHNIKALFRDYKTFARKTYKYKNLYPILFIDEIDQLLTSRDIASWSSSHTYLRVQSIFLNEIEQLKGILIGTTNFADIIDFAWYRRFNLKIHVPIPGYSTRIKIWRSYLSMVRVYSKEVNEFIKEHLANFPVTGGVIKNFVKNMFIYGITSPKKLLEQKDFILARLKREVTNFNAEGNGYIIKGFSK